MIQRARSCLVADSRADGLAPDCSLKAHIAHQPLYCTPRHVMVLAPQLPPDLAHAIDLEVVIEDPAYLGLQGGVTLGSRRSLGRMSTPGDMSVSRPGHMSGRVLRFRGSSEQARASPARGDT